MGSDRAAAEALTPEALSERRRLTGLLMLLVDALIGESEAAGHPVARGVYVGVARDLVLLRRAVREGWTEDEFRRACEAALPQGEEVEG